MKTQSAATSTRNSARRSSQIGMRIAAIASLSVTLSCNDDPYSPDPIVSSGSAQLVQVAAFDHQVTGVTVTPTGRIFVNFPRWTEDAPVSVAEVQSNGSITPYPNADWNAWRNATKNQMTPGDHWVCVQSVVADTKGNLWVLDPAAPATQAIVPGGPKLVRIVLATNTVAQTILFDTTIAPNGSYLNDVRFSPDGRYAYITDSGGGGALIVVDLTAATARRLLSGHPTVQPEKDVVVKADSQPVRRPDGRGIEFASDGIALSSDGAFLYLKAVTAKTLYRIATSALQDRSLSAANLASRIEKVATLIPSDGLWTNSSGRIYLTAVEDNSIRYRESNGGDALTLLVKDSRLRWPDTMSEGPDGTLYVTASRIPDMMWYKPENPPALSTTLFKIVSK